MGKPEKVAILGASSNPDRYSYRALRMLQQHGHVPLPVSVRDAEIEGVRCVPRIEDLAEKPDTVTVYVGHDRVGPLVPGIVSSGARRVIMNPGAESAALREAAEKAGMDVLEACTLVMLQTGQF